MNVRSFKKGGTVPRTPEQFDEIRERSRERILQSALRLFAGRGFATTTVRMIAEEAGVSQGLLYNYYDGKQGLLRAVFERGLEEVREDLAAATSAASPREGLALLVRAAFETLRSSPDFWRLSYQLRMQPEVLADLGGQVAAWSEAIRSQIESLLRGAPDRGVRARALFAAIDGAAQHYVLEPGSYPLDAVADELIRLHVPGKGATLQREREP
jgi:AcrR family transcriptional regulator